MANQIFRCGQCKEDWPATDEYKECPGCGTPTATLATDEEPDEFEAQTRANHARFDRYLKEETPEQRLERQANSPYNQEFNEVIQGAGFQEWERESIQTAEGEFVAEEEKAA